MKPQIGEENLASTAPDSLTSDFLPRKDINLLSIYARAPWMDEPTRKDIEVKLSPLGKVILQRLTELSSSESNLQASPESDDNRYSKDAEFFWDWAKQSAR